MAMESTGEDCKPVFNLLEGNLQLVGHHVAAIDFALVEMDDGDESVSDERLSSQDPHVFPVPCSFRLTAVVHCAWNRANRREGRS